MIRVKMYGSSSDGSRTHKSYIPTMNKSYTSYSNFSSPSFSVTETITGDGTFQSFEFNGSISSATSNGSCTITVEAYNAATPKVAILTVNNTVTVNGNPVGLDADDGTGTVIVKKTIDGVAYDTDKGPIDHFEVTMAPESQGGREYLFYLYRDMSWTSTRLSQPGTYTIKETDFGESGRYKFESFTINGVKYPNDASITVNANTTLEITLNNTTIVSTPSGGSSSDGSSDGSSPGGSSPGGSSPGGTTLSDGSTTTEEPEVPEELMTPEELAAAETPSAPPYIPPAIPSTNPPRPYNPDRPVPPEVVPSNARLVVDNIYEVIDDDEVPLGYIQIVYNEDTDLWEIYDVMPPLGLPTLPITGGVSLSIVLLAAGLLLIGFGLCVRFTRFNF